jgi:hypothetical protein
MTKRSTIERRAASSHRPQRIAIRDGRVLCADRDPRIARAHRPPRPRPPAVRRGDGALPVLGAPARAVRRRRRPFAFVLDSATIANDSATGLGFTLARSGSA